MVEISILSSFWCM